MRRRQEELRFTHKAKEEDDNCYLIREMAENKIVYKDINVGSPDKRMSSTMRKNIATGGLDMLTTGRGLNGNDEDGG